MLYWDVLAEVLDRAARAGVAPQFIETNCPFADSEDAVRHRFTFFKEQARSAWRSSPVGSTASTSLRRASRSARYVS